MILAVVEDRAEVHYRNSRQVPARSRISDAPLHGRNPVLGDGAAKYIVDELHALAALDGFHLDPAHAKLSVPAGLFLVLAFDIGFAADGFAVRNFRRFQSEVD